MSNYELQSKLREVERELARVQQINNELRAELSTVVNGVNSAERTLTDYNNVINNTLNNCNSVMQSSHQRVIEAYEIQGEIEVLYARFKNVELANKKIRECNNKKYYDFSNYRTVRKIVQGIMDNLDVRMISDEVITKSVEKKHLQTPDYWLTCVLISVMAWKNHDKELADRAIARAISLDKKNSAVFYMLFNLRMERENAALKWFYTYQECELKGSDQRTFLMLFSLISKTLNETVDEEMKTEIFDFIQKVVAANAKASGYSEEDVINSVLRYLKRMEPAEQLEYKLLRKYVTEFDDLTSLMMQAKNNINILEFMLCVLNVPVEQKNAFIKTFIDELINRPNQVEEQTYEDIEYNELVIRYEGDVGRAKEAFDKEQQRRHKELNLIAEMMAWIFEKDEEGVSGQSRLSMFLLTKDIQEKSVAAYVENYRSARKNTHSIRIGDYSATADLTDEAGETAKIERFFTEKKDKAAGEIKNTTAYICFGAGVAAAVGSIYAGMWLLALALGAILFGVFALISNNSKKKQLEQTCSENIKNTTEVLKNMILEYKQYNEQLDEYDEYYDRITEEFRKL